MLPFGFGGSIGVSAAVSTAPSRRSRSPMRGVSAPTYICSACSAASVFAACPT